MIEKNNIPTLYFIGVVAWAISNAGHEIVGHGLTCVLLGYEVLGVSTSFLIRNETEVSFWDNKLIIIGGIVFNICISLFSYIILTKHVAKDIHSKYFFWLLLSFNLFYSGSYIMGWFIGPSLDSALFMVGFKPQMILKLILSLVGLAVIVLAFQISSRTLHFIVDANGSNFGKKITTLTFYPYIAAVTIKVLAGLMNQSDEKMLIILGSFGATGIFLVWINLIRFWPNLKPSNDPVPNISLNTKWITSGIIIMLIYIFILGKGIGQIY
jgi:hypothetical protein